MTGLCTDSGLKFLISADSFIHHPLDDIKIFSPAGAACLGAWMPRRHSLDARAPGLLAQVHGAVAAQPAQRVLGGGMRDLTCDFPRDFPLCLPS
jgi:hypothetical protein